VHSALVALWGEVPVVVSVMTAAVHPSDSSTVMFAAMEHLISASGTVAVASKIGGTIFASTSAFGSSAVA
jgi:hypothetical protein